MDTALISAFSALGGSVVGGLASGVGTLLSQRAQAKDSQRGFEILRRQDLYRDFIVAASKSYGHAMVSNEPQVQDLVELYALLSRMRIISTPEIVACADKVMVTIIDTFFAPNLTVREVREVMKQKGSGIDPLKEFSQFARDELTELKTGLRPIDADRPVEPTPTR